MVTIPELLEVEALYSKIMAYYGLALHKEEAGVDGGECEKLCDPLNLAIWSKSSIRSEVTTGPGTPMMSLLNLERKRGRFLRSILLHPQGAASVSVVPCHSIYSTE